MSKYKYQNNINGSQIILNIGKSGESRHFACCSCCLDHLFIFEPGPKNGQITLTVYRDDYRTMQLRKEIKNKFKRVD